MQMERICRVIEGQGIVVIIQEDAKALHLRVDLHQHFFVVVSHHEVVVAAREDPGGGVLANPLILWGRFICYTNSIPRAESNRHTLPI